ncbi:TetR family transcriptional regulator [Granulicella sp. 5B5]|uniref:TetR/AcrR family transcriptional regulator n=1 Tax=Granulicella sp. 5B5 TaxID=1617967 RepID=UPI0015F76600|nr:TetR/AcrR family transcriptional regulator [Granulicella sp. 5B5]QMV19125.1 TetR family transcriptional regulator [Granulicella sp. 5B5]
MATQTTRDHLIDVGVTLMHRNGYHATGLNEILASAQVPKGSFYHYFGSKEDFAVAVLERYAARVGEHCETVLSDTNLPPLKRLRRYFAELIKIYGQKGDIPGCMVGKFSLEAADHSTILRKHLSGSFNHWQHGLSAVLRQARDQKELPPDADPDSLAGFLINSWQGALLRSLAEKSDDPLKTFLHYTFDSLLSHKSN